MDNEPSIQMAEESRSYLKMAELLKKARPIEAARMVQDILETDASLEAKIGKIEAIDAQEVEGELARKEISEKDTREILRKKQITPPETVQKNSSKIRVRPHRNQFFIFLFKDFKTLREFGQRTGLIQTRFFPPSVRLSGYQLSDALLACQKDASELVPMVNLVLEKGWNFLEKSEYNLIAVFKRMLESLLALPPVPGAIQPRQLLGIMEVCETRYLICRYRPEYPEMIQITLKKAFTELHQSQAKAAIALMLTKRLLESSDRDPCLSSVLLAPNMADCRKMIRIEDLIRAMPGGVLGNFDYDCTPEVREKIRLTINDSISRLKTLMGEKGEVGKIRSFLKQYMRENSDGSKIYNFAPVAEFYDLHPREGRNFARDKEDMARFILRFFNKFLAEFDTFFSEKTEIEGMGQIKIFASDLFQLELDRLRHLMSKYEQMSFALPTLTRKEFWDLKQARREKAPLPEELIIIQTAEKGSENLLELGKKLGHLVMRHRPATSEVDHPEWIPIGQGVFIDPFFDSPIWGRRILSGNFLKGKEVGEVLKMTADLCLLSAVFFFDSHIYATLERESRLNESMKEIRKTLERLADPVTYEKIQTMEEY